MSDRHTPKVPVYVAFKMCGACAPKQLTHAIPVDLATRELPGANVLLVICTCLGPATAIDQIPAKVARYGITRLVDVAFSRSKRFGTWVMRTWRVRAESDTSGNVKLTAVFYG